MIFGTWAAARETTATATATMFVYPGGVTSRGTPVSPGATASRANLRRAPGAAAGQGAARSSEVTATTLIAELTESAQDRTRNWNPCSARRRLRSGTAPPPHTWPR